MTSAHNSWLVMFAGACGATTLLTLVCLEIGKMTGGSLHYLAETNEKLAERLERYFPPRQSWLVAGRILITLTIGLAVCFLQNWWHTLRHDPHHLLQLWKPITIIAISYLDLELFSGLLTTSASARLLLVVLPIFKFTSLLLYPICQPLAFISEYAASRQAARKDGNDSLSVEDEIISLVENQNLGPRYALKNLEEDERRMILGALSLDNVPVRRIMTPRIDVIGVQYEPGTPLEEFINRAQTAIVQSGHSQLPVFQGNIDHIIGTIHAEDLLDPARRQDSRKLIHASPLLVAPSRNLGDLLALFLQSKTTLAIVMDEYGGTLGIVTFKDVLEPIVGDIKDKYDADESKHDIREISPGVYACNARATVDDVNRVLDTDIPGDEDYDTIGGYLTATLERIPAEGETIRTDQLTATITKADARRILAVTIKRAS